MQSSGLRERKEEQRDSCSCVDFNNPDRSQRPRREFSLSIEDMEDRPASLCGKASTIRLPTNPHVLIESTLMYLSATPTLSR